MQYTFGNTDLAARRLKALAEVFAEPTEAFLQETVAGRPALALDLGCGPGHSTHFLADRLACKHVAGLDNSQHFITLAQRTQTEKVSFHLHDVSSVPFPLAPADLIYCRFLLTHLKEPQRVVAGWSTQLRPKGLLLMEEVDWIQTENATFRTYLQIVAAMLEHQGNALYVGPVLDRLENTEALAKRTSLVRRLRVPNHEAAHLFYLNIRTWKHHPFIRAHYAAAMIDGLEEELGAITEAAREKSEIEWGMRQIAFERA